MATKTVVCPECGSAAAPGRYACAECGALLASVAASPRANDIERDSTGSADPEVTAEPMSDAHVTDTAKLEAPSMPTPEPAHSWDAMPVSPSAAPVEPTATRRTPQYLPSNGRPARSGAQSEPPWAEASAWDDDIADGSPSQAGGAILIDEDAPIGTAIDPVVAPLAAVAAAHAAPGPFVQSPAPTSAPTWPPAGDRGPQPMPVSRTPAGAYLPPSAVLEALDPAGPTAPPERGRGRRDAAGSEKSRTMRGLDLRRLVGSLDLADDTPRAVIAVGAAIAAIGFLLPWANVLAGAGLLGGYFTQWGLAGPGHWIVVVLLLGMVVVALAGAATARWPVGPGATALAALLLGMTWPYLFGVLGKSVGVWVVLAGAIVLVVGSVLNGRDRHDPERPPVG